MSPSSWVSSIRLFLDRLTSRENRLPRIAILGIGNTLRSDDAAGVLVARRLRESRLTRGPETVLVLEGGHAPENSTARLRRFAPQFVVLIDAAEMGTAPGAIRWIDVEEMDGMSASTHTWPLSMLAKYLSLELDCEVKLLGIQPRSIDVGESVSAEVSRAVDEIVDWLLKVLQILPADPSQDECLSFG